jgi:penicillin amidase
VPLSAAEQEARALLQSWDFRFTAEAQGAVVFQHLLDSLSLLTFDEVWQYEEEGRALLRPETWRLIDLLARYPNHPVLDRLDTPVRENADSLLRQAFRQAVPAATARNWNELRATEIRHLARIPGLGSDILYTDGARDTPNALGTGFGPSWRMVVSLEKPVRAWGVIPGGASGNPGSQDYDSGLEAWAKGEYFELPLWNGPEDPTIDARMRISVEKETN